VHDGAQLRTFGLGEGVVFGPADEGERLCPERTALVWPPPVSIVTIFTTISDSAK
jgi:hypothetical protein